MAEVQKSLASDVGTPTFACVRCVQRKVKCDRQRPCSACAKHEAECVFQPPRPPRRRRRPVAARLPMHAPRHVPVYIANKSADPVDVDVDARHQTPSHSVCSSLSSQPERRGTINRTRVIQGKGQSRLINNGLWSRVAEEFHNSENDLLDDSGHLSDVESPSEACGFTLDYPPTARVKFTHPSLQQMHQLWDIFIENVDPLTKIVHVITLKSAFHEAIGNIKAVSRNFEALMFALYSAAVMSLSEAQCDEMLNESRKTLRAKLTAATKLALSHANFMATSSLIVLQALILHIISAQDMYESRALWTLTGVAVRIASGMGLDRDGLSDGLPPFETEIRRRIWWLLKAQDQRSAELCGLAKFRDIDLSRDSTRRPANVNDIDLYPEMSDPLEDSDSLTDMTFLTIKYELLQFAATRVAEFQRLGKDLGKWDDELASEGNKADTDQSWKEIEEHLETKYLRRCDPSQPLQLMSMLMARAAIDTIRFMTHHPRRWGSIDQSPPAERQWVWEVSIRLLEQRDMLQSNPMLKRFAWHAAFVMQWPVFIHVLDTLRANPLVVDADKAWKLIQRTFENNPSLLSDGMRPIHRAVGSLCLKAYDARVLQGDCAQIYPTATFISKLRKQKTAVNANRRAQLAKAEDVHRLDLVRAGVAPIVSNVEHSTPIDDENLTQNINYHDEHPSADHVISLEEQPPDAETLGGTGMDFLWAADDDVYENLNWEKWDFFLNESNMQ